MDMLPDILPGLVNWKMLNLGSNEYHASAILLSTDIDTFKLSSLITSVRYTDSYTLV